jgi:hypothetical protein
MKRAGLSSAGLAYLLVAVVVVASVGVAIFATQAKTSAVQQTQTQFTASITTGPSSNSSSGGAVPNGENASADSLYGLQLRVDLNATNLLSGESLQVEVSEFNTLSTFNNVSASDQWPIRVALGSCPNVYDQPFGIAVYSGHVDEQNLSQGVQLQIFPRSACPMFIRAVTGYAFQPQSDLAVVLPNVNAVPSPLIANVTVSMIYSGLPQPLPAGTYTVVAADEWGALLFLYFTVL